MKNHRKSKCIFSLILCGLVALSFAGCESGQGDTSSNSISSKSANSETTSSKTTNVVSENKKEDTFEIANYLGTSWASEDIVQDVPCYILEFFENDENSFLLDLSCYQNGTGGFISTINHDFSLSDLSDNQLSFHFAQDSWGNSGDVTIVFQDDCIQLNVENVEVESTARWRPTEGVVTLVDNPNASEELYDSYDDYEEPDLSHASGILASRGMTEDEFIDSCYEMQSPQTEQNQYNWFVNYRKVMYRLNDQDYFENMLDYPSTYLNEHYRIIFKVTYKNKTSDEKIPYYLGKIGLDNIIVYDRRDDTLSPNISLDDTICAYCIFTGISTNSMGEDQLCFVMITAEK